MLPRCMLRPPSRAFTSATSAKLTRVCVVHSSPHHQQEAESNSVSSHSALTRQQLEFCCLLSGYDVACSTCPFNWFNFDPKKFRTRQRRRKGARGGGDDGGDFSRFAASEKEIREAMEVLGIDATPSDGFDKVSISQQQVKGAFRAKALEWHPDCNQDPDAESMFKDIVEAYELLLAHAQ